MKIVHYYAPAFGHWSGVTEAISLWAARMARAGSDVSIIAAPGRDTSLQKFDVPTQAIAHHGKSRASFIPKRREFVAGCRGADVVMLHEGWTVSHLVAAAILRQHQIPYVVMPHGVYEEQIVASLRRPRRLRAALESVMLSNAEFVHIYFPGEARLVRKVSPRVRTLVAPTGFEASEAADWNGGPDVLWFGRIDVRHKGLDLLLQGMASLPRAERPRVRLAGYDYNGGVAALHRLVRELDLTDSVSMCPPLRGADKSDALSSAAAYVHPSRWECHSISLLEAMASGAPVYVSDSVHIAGLIKRVGGAELVSSSPEGWAEALRAIGCGDARDLDRRQFWSELDWERSMATFYGAITSRMNE